MTYDFTQIREVTLSEGDHDSPEDGLCFMEMAAWFAGEKHSDEPECACPVLGRYGIELNDAMSGEERDRLLKPLVPMIVGTRDPDSERKRAEFLAMWAVNKIAPLALRAKGFDEHAERCENARTLTEAKNAARAASAANAAYAARAAARAASAANAAYAARAASAAIAAFTAANAAAIAANAADVWPTAVEGLRQAILIGKHEGIPAHIDPQERHAALRQMVGADQ